MNNKFLLIVPLMVFLSFSIGELYSQSCPCTVNAGPDKNLCDPGGTVQLDGSYTGQPLIIEWTPSDGLSDPSVLKPMATVDQTTTYTLKVKCQSNTNLVTNSNFNSGNTGFSSDYTYATNLVPEGLYAVTNNPQSVHSGFAPCGDHTGGGQMMVVNGAGMPGLNVWCQTIPVKPNTDYSFETWVASVVGSSPAMLQFSINGQTIGNVFTASTTTCLWEQFYAVWNSGSSTTATICIVNQNTEFGGNDFALDDISFKELCELTDQVTVFVHPVKQTDIQAKICKGQTYTIGGQSLQNEGTYNFTFKTWKGCDSLITLDLEVIEVEAVIEEPEFLDCDSDEVFLFGDGSSFGSFYSYSWTGPPGGIKSDPSQANITVNKPGVYTLVVTYDDGQIKCTQTAKVTVFTDYTKPVISAGPDGVLSCADTILTLSGTVTSPAVDYTIVWTTPDGKILSDPDVLDLLIGSPGTYIMTITNNMNGCTASDVALVTKDPSLPKAIITGDKILNCYKDTIWINGFQSDQGAGFSFAWSTANGAKIISNPDSLAVQLSNAGTYILTITNLQSGCKSSTSLNVTDDKNFPLAEAGVDDTLSCLIPELSLSGSSNLPDSLITISWSTNLGQIKSGGNSYTPVIGAPGIYYISILNKTNGCLSVDSVKILTNDNIPVIAPLTNKTLNCIISVVTLDGTGSSTGTDYLYSWTTPNGNITGPSDQLQTQCDQPGLYILSITNTKNGCQVTDSLVVNLDNLLPEADAGADQTLNCYKPGLELDGSQSSAGSQYSYLWTTQGGNILNGADTQQPEIDKPGAYIITVLNNDNGCTKTDTVNVAIDTVAPKINMPADKVITCQQPQTVLTATNGAGQGNFNYQWTTSGGNILSGNGTLSVTVDKPGTYLLTATNNDNGCTSTGMVTVISNSELPVVDAGKDLLLDCNNTQVTAGASVVYNGGTLDISWASSIQAVLSGGNTLTPIIGFAGTYTIKVQDPVTGCSASDQLEVTIDTISPKTAIPVPGLLTCATTQTNVGLQTTDPTWTYVWTTANGNITGSTNGSNITVDSTGVYMVTVTNTINGCTAVYSQAVGEDKNKPVVSAGPDNELTCTQKEVTLIGGVQGGTNNKTVQWYYNSQPLANGTMLTPQVGIAGIYTLIVTDNGNGCSASDTTEVTENTNYPTDFLTDVIPPGCTKLGKITVSGIEGGVGPYTYSVNGGSYQTAEIFESITSGNYFINIKDANGCEYGEQLTVPDPPELTLTLPHLVTIEYGKDEQLNPQLNIPEANVESAVWTPVDGLSCGDCLHPFANPVNETSYTLTVTDVTGCTAKAKVKVVVLKDFDLYVPNAFSPDGNGINDKWTIFGDPKIVVRINILRIFDRWGESMYEAREFPVNDPEYGWDGKLRGKNLKPAVFVYYFEAEFVDGSKRIYKGDINLMR